MAEDDYVGAKIAAALKAAGGDRHEARKTLVAWATRDQILLLGITKPHLKAIATAAIENASRSGKSASKDKGKSAEGFSRKDVDAMIASGKGGDRRAFTPPPPPPKSSARQASVMQQLAAAFKKKGK